MRQLFPEWRDELSRIAYPFENQAIPENDNGSPLPPGAILDALIYPAGGVGGYYLHFIAISRGQVNFVINDANHRECCAGYWSGTGDDPSIVELFDDDEQPAGVLTIDSTVVASLEEDWGRGVFYFLPESAAFVPRTWDIVTGIQPGVDRTGEEIQPAGDLYLVAENGMRFECVDDQTVAIHAIGDPLAKRKECGDSFEVPRFIRQLIFQKGPQTIACDLPDSGEVTLLADSPDVDNPALRLSSTPGKIRVEFFGQET